MIEKEMDRGKFESGIEDQDWRMRQAWVKFAGTQIKDGKQITFTDISVLQASEFYLS
jgi:hypothetical protein